MIVGIPNVGKSSLINKIAGKKSAVTGDRPGVTRNKQWIKFEDKTVGINLAVTGAIKDEIIDFKNLSGEY